MKRNGNQEIDYYIFLHQYVIPNDDKIYDKIAYR